LERENIAVRVRLTMEFLKACGIILLSGFHFGVTSAGSKEATADKRMGSSPQNECERNYRSNCAWKDTQSMIRACWDVDAHLTELNNGGVDRVRRRIDAGVFRRAWLLAHHAHPCMHRIGAAEGVRAAWLL
jgi:hypothetical protein